MLDIRTAVRRAYHLPVPWPGRRGWSRGNATKQGTSDLLASRRYDKVESRARGEPRGPKVVDARPPPVLPRPMPVTSETWNAKLGESFVLIGWTRREAAICREFRADSLLELVRTVRTAHSDNECRVLSSALLVCGLSLYFDRGRGSEDCDR